MPFRLSAEGSPTDFESLLFFTSDVAIGSLVNSMFLNDAITRSPEIGLPVIFAMLLDTSCWASNGLVLM